MLASWLYKATVCTRSPSGSVSQRLPGIVRSPSAFRGSVPRSRFNPTSDIQCRFFRSGPTFRQGRFQYQQFGGARGGRGIPIVTLLRRWSARPTFKYEAAGLGGAAGGFYIYNLEDVPISGRRRFNVVSDESMKSMGMQAYEQTLQEYQSAILSDFDPRVRQVKRVLDRLIPASGIDRAEWQVHVIDSEETNAFVLPGGKVFVFTGILPVCNDDAGLAAVLGHEIGHNVAKHSAEKVSQSYILSFVFMALQQFFQLPDIASNALLTLAFERPGSRMQESEADYIGLMMMAESCYDPSAAVQFWHRMREVEKTHPAPPQLLSTHPSSANREKQLQEWLPKAMEKYDATKCGALSTAAQEFRSRVQAPFNYI